MHLVPPGSADNTSAACCDRFAIHFANEVLQIHSGLDSGLVDEGLMGMQLVSFSEDVDKIRGHIMPTTCVLDPCHHSWLLESANRIGRGCFPAGGHGSNTIKGGSVDVTAKETFLGLQCAEQQQVHFKCSILIRMLNHVVALQLQSF